MIRVPNLVGQHTHIYILAVEACYDPALSNRDDIDTHPEIALPAARLGINPALPEHLAGEPAQLGLNLLNPAIIIAWASA